MALFGHQFKRMSEPTSAFDLQIDILLAMDLGVFFDQMKHAADDIPFQIFVWGWIVIGFFLLINIFISIIIDSYVSCKEVCTKAKSLSFESHKLQIVLTYLL